MKHVLGNRGRRFILFTGFLVGALSCSKSPVGVNPVAEYCDPAARDQDDLCFWINPDNASRSTVITSDKKADAVFVYDLQGNTVQRFSTHKPGNIDARHGFPLAGRQVDIVAWNERGTQTIVVCKVNPLTRQLERIDNGTIHTRDAYGGALYHSIRTNRFYFFATSKTGAVAQYELFDNGKGQVSGKNLRTLKVSACEAAVADDELGRLFVSAEKEGIWECGAEPQDAPSGTWVDRVGSNGLQADVEGCALYPEKNGTGFLIVSSQGNSRFNVYERQSPHHFIGSFRVRGVSTTDGIEVTATNCGTTWSAGMFVCHNGAFKDKCPVVLVPWNTIAAALHLKIPPG